MKYLSPEYCYILGFLWADGSIRNAIGNKVRIKLKSIDMDSLLHIFLSTGDWAIKRTNYSKNEMTTLSFSDKLIYDFLYHLDYHKKTGASAKKVLDFIPEDLRHYWWRGYFDGDGSIAKNIKCVCITACFKQNWSFVKFLPKDIKGRVYRSKVMSVRTGAKTSGVSRFVLHKYVGRKFLEYIYQGKWFGLTRKLKKLLSSTWGRENQPYLQLVNCPLSRESMKSIIDG